MRVASRFFGDYDAVYAADSGLVGAQEAGLHVNYVVGDMDSLPDPRVLDTYDSNQIVRFPCDKDLTDTELALKLMGDHGITEIVLIGGDGGRMDHFFALYRLFSLENPPILWIGSDTIARTIEAGSFHPAVSVQDLESEAAVSIFPVGSDIFPSVISSNFDSNISHSCVSDGLHWPVDDLLWDRGQFSLSNRAPLGSFKIEAILGRFLVIVPLKGTHSLS